ncbi:MAG: hypothetical protein ACM359_10980, partial [Bacillota bacterium]
IPLTRNLSDWEIGRGRGNEIYYELVGGASAVDGQFGIWPEGVDPRAQGSGRNEGHHLLLYGDGQRVVSWAPSKSGGVVFAHFGRFVRPGDHRVAADSNDPFVRAVAFASQKKAYVLVLINNRPAPAPVTIAVRNSIYQVRKTGGMMTDTSHTLATASLQPDAGKTKWSARLPALSLSTFLFAENFDSFVGFDEHSGGGHR